MKTFDGYSKEKFSDTSVLLAGGGSKELSNFIGTLNWDSTNRKLQYKKIGDTNWSDLVTFGSNATNSTAYLPLAGGTMTGAIGMGSDATKWLITTGTNGANSPLRGIKMPTTTSSWLGLFARPSKATNEGGLLLSEDTCVIYNSFDTGYGLAVYDTDMNLSDWSGNLAFGINSSYQAWAKGGFKKNGSSDSYVLLGGGGHKAISDFAMASHDHNRIKGPDARSSNNNPLWYMTNRGSGSVTSEFSSQGTSVLGRTYTNLTTFTPCGDSSGDYPVLLAFNLTGMAMRTAASTNAWNSWPSGNIYAGNFYTASDIRYKKILSHIKVSIKQLAKIPLFNFTWTDINDNMIHSGTSALKVKKFLPHIVTGSNKLTLDYATLGTIAGITACKELVAQKSEIDLLKERIELLELQLKMINDYGRC